MTNLLPPFAALRAFEAVGRLSGIRRAASALGISHAIVSRHVRSLEKSVGTLLFDRANGNLTEAGRSYHARISASIGEMMAATNAVRDRRSGQLVIWCAPGLAASWLTGRLPRFAALKSQLIIDLRSEILSLDLGADRVDGDIRWMDDAAPPSERAVRSVELARPDIVPVCSPPVAERLRATLRTAADFLDAPLIEEGGPQEWRLWFDNQGINDTPRLRVGRYGHAHLALAAARAGQGVALGNHYLIGEDVAAGRLVVLEAADRPLRTVKQGAYLFAAQSSMWADPAIVSFRNWLVEEFRRDAPPTARGGSPVAEEC